MLQTKNVKWFEEWVQNLRNHRLYRQNELNYGSRDAPLLTQIRNDEETTTNNPPPHSASGKAANHLCTYDDSVIVLR